MSMALGRIAVTIAACAALRAAAATPFGVDLTDLWWDPKESGWGLNVVQQSNVLFATLFVYDATGRARWFVAPNLAGTKIRDGQRDFFTGRLYETSGPVFSASTFDPARVVRREVGPVTLEYPVPGEFAGEGVKALFGYAVDGVQVSKRLERQTWAAKDFSGSYSGVLATQPLSLSGACAAKTGVRALQGMTVAHAGASFSMRAVQGSGPPAELCRYTGTYSQAGNMGSVSGVFSCDGGASGPFFLSDVEIGRNAVTAKYNAQERGCDVVGNFAAVRGD
jgi:hypothetical protein